MSSVTAPLSSSAFFTPLLFTLHNTSDSLGSSAQRLASGNRIIRASDDIAAFSIATSLKSQLTGLNQASSNVAQATSLLQVAEGGLQEISDILATMKTLAQQANSGSLTDVERSFLQTQFAQSMETIDTIVSSTTFNNINLLDGTLAGGNQLTSETDVGTKASAQITLTGNVGGGETLVLNGVTFTEGVDFDAEGTASETAEAIVDALNESTNVALSRATYSSNGSVITITAKTGGTLGNQYTINEGTSTAAFTTDGGATNAADVYTLEGGSDAGLAVNGVKVTGSVDDPIATALSQTPASVTVSINGAIIDGETLNFDNGNGGLIAFTFRNAPVGATEIQIGGSTEETLDNAIEIIRAYSIANAADNNYGLRQLEFTTNTNQLIITNRNVGNATDLAGAALDITETLTNGSLSAAAFSNGSATGGVNASGVNNTAFVGTVGGFTATYDGADAITASITVGSSTYTAEITDTTPAGDTTVRFSSTSGGYFDIQLDGGAGIAVADQDDADIYATHLDSVFGGLEFYQSRPVTSLTAAGLLSGATASITTNDFSNLRLTNITVTAPTSADATIDFTINGKTFRAQSGLGETLGGYEKVTFTNIDDSNETLTLINGATEQDFSTASAAETFQTALRTAFNLNETGDGTNFQIGARSTDLLNVSVGNAGTSALFSTATPNISTQVDAVAAQDLVDTASDLIQTIISNVGALQSTLDSTSGNLSQSILGVTSAHSALVDTDIVAESSIFAQETLKLNAGIAVLAQALSLPSGLLSVLHSFGNN